MFLLLLLLFASEHILSYTQYLIISAVILRRSASFSAFIPSIYKITSTNYDKDYNKWSE